MTKLFISHASEDKDDVARPLCERLRWLGYEVWFDEYSLKIGDSLIQQIDKGLSECDLAILILSKKFFKKEWPIRELTGLTTLEMSYSRKLILPVWHNISKDEILKYSPPLADKLGVSTENGTIEIAKSLADTIGPPILNPPARCPYSQLDIIQNGYPMNIHIIEAVCENANHCFNKYLILKELSSIGIVSYYKSSEIGSSINPNEAVTIILEAAKNVEVSSVISAAAVGGILNPKVIFDDREVNGYLSDLFAESLKH